MANHVDSEWFKMMSGMTNLKQAMMPLVWLNCIFCMGIFEIPINRPRYFLSVIYVISIMTGYFITLYKGLFIYQKAYQFEFMIFYYVTATCLLVAILDVILFWCKSKDIYNAIKRSSLADKTLEELGIYKDYPKICRNILYQMAVWAGCMVIIFILNLFWTHNNDIEYWDAFYNCICVCFPIMISSVVHVTFSSLLRCLQIKFQQTNTLMSNVVLCTNEPKSTFVVTNHKNHKDKILHLIQTLRHLHLEITRIGREINSAYCVQLLLELAVNFATVTSTAFCVYCAVTDQLHVTLSNEMIFTMIIWGGIYLLKLVLINCLCTNVSIQAYKTGEIIQSFEVSAIDSDLREEIHQFTQQIQFNSLKFTAAGFFRLGNCLTGKFVLTVMTYVIILIQMYKPKVQFVQRNGM